MTTRSLRELIYAADPDFGRDAPVIEYAFSGRRASFEARDNRGAYDGATYPPNPPYYGGQGGADGTSVPTNPPGFEGDGGVVPVEIYLRADGGNTMSADYDPSADENIATVEYVQAKYAELIA